MTGKHVFDTKVTIEHIQDVPFNRGHLFAKMKLKSGKFSARTETKQIKNHKVDWHETFELQCSFKTDNGRLNDKILRITVKRETNGGNDSEKLGYCDINLGERAAYSAPCQGRYLLVVKKKSNAAAGNSIVVVTTSMVQVMGDPIFKTVENTQIKTLTGKDHEIQSNLIGLTNIPDRESSSSEEGESIYSGRTQSGLFSPAHSSDNVPSTDTVTSEAGTSETGIYTQSLDRYRWRNRAAPAFLQKLTKSHSSISISDRTKSVDSVNRSHKSHMLDPGLVDKESSTAQRRQDSGLGGSRDLDETL